MTVQIDDALLDPLVEAETLLVALDFDGTLAPFEKDPADSRMVPAAAEALAELREAPGVALALVSGRAVESLTAAARPAEGDYLAGSHGLEIREPGEKLRLLAPEEALQRRDALHDVLHSVVSGVPDAWVESKPAGFAVHTRALSEQAAEELGDRAAAAVVARGIPASSRRGNGVREFALAEADKGQAIEHFRRVVGADAVLFAGDDVTDEDGFAVMGLRDLGVKVGEGRTRARARVASPGELAALLLRIKKLRS
ncbi:trehalose-phosphatase [Mycetocola reblochoni]|uniref:Trehalose 6-phosphate phosphatase n=2 Tax=Mycetocola reblochoni TaxID=331618 RepID=A0A1R4JA41_9MICO|nr:trehalose-phosphatase [Mycetocola reblochoni]RLP70043.1 trehalose-phosphatase [Mycetocola reblochoni]SJN29001.1 Trehalose-6-phosphate phosphatase [Mycetocola reblochoni REB411]